MSFPLSFRRRAIASEAATPTEKDMQRKTLGSKYVVKT
jgi:hypothetical protein